MDIIISARAATVEPDSVKEWVKVTVHDADLGHLYDVIEHLDLVELTNEVGVERFLDAIGIDAAKKRFRLVEEDKVRRLADAAHGLKVANRSAMGDRVAAHRELLDALHDLEGGRRQEVPCPKCVGTKKVIEKTCPRCGGTGVIEEGDR